MRKLLIAFLLIAVCAPAQVVIVRRRAGSSSPGATFTEQQHKQNDHVGSASSLAVTVTSTTAGQDIIVCVGWAGATTSQISSVADNASGGTNTYTKRATTLGSNASGNFAVQCADSLNTPRGGATTITITYSGSMSYQTAFVFTVSRTSGTSSFDIGGGTTNATGSTTTANGPSVTTTATGYCIAAAVPNNTISASPKAGNEFTSGGDVQGNGPASASLMNSSAASHQPVWTLGTSGDTFAATVSCYK